MPLGSRTKPTFPLPSLTLPPCVTEEPPAGLPYYGPWGDRETIYLGSPQNKMARGTCPGIMMTDPREVRIAELEQKLADLGVELAR